MKKFALFFSLLLPACEVAQKQPQPQQQEPEKPAQWPRAPQLEAKYGKAHGPSPCLSGEYAMNYVRAARGEIVEIVYEGATKPREIRTYEGNYAVDGTLSIMGQTVAFYGSGNEDSAISTQAILLTDPAGRKGWWTFVFHAPEHQKGQNIPTFTW